MYHLVPTFFEIIGVLLYCEIHTKKNRFSGKNLIRQMILRDEKMCIIRFPHFLELSVFCSIVKCIRIVLKFLLVGVEFLCINKRAALGENQFIFGFSIEYFKVIFFREVLEKKIFFYVTMEAFAILKKAASYSKPLMSFSQLSVGEYIVSEFSLVQTKFGPKIKCDLGDKVVFLPSRFVKDMDEEKVLALNSVPQILVFSGIDYERSNL